jgi:hypothetical protein
MAVMWCDGGCAEVVVGVRRQSHCVAVAAWHGNGRRSHGLVVVVAVVLWRLRHGCGGSGGGHTMAVTAVTSRHNGCVA